MFHVGQKVVCINDDENAFWYQGSNFRAGDFHLVKGQIYTIRWLGTDGWSELPTCKLAELPDRQDDGGYAQARFRPLVKRKTSIEVFKRMLKRDPVEGTKHIRELWKEKEPT